MRVTGTLSWIFLAALALAIVTALCWGIFGSVPTRIAGQGMFVAESRATQAVGTSYGGDLRRILVNPGDDVRPGDAIAQFDQPEREQQLEAATRTLALLVKQRQDVADFYDALIRKHGEASEAERRNADTTISLMERSVATQRQLLESFRALFAQGLTTKLQVEEIAQKHDASAIQLQQAKAQLEKSYVDDLNTANLRDAALREYDARITEATEREAQARSAVELGSIVKSPTFGRIVTIDAEQNTRVEAGATIATIAEAGKDLEAVVFVSARDGTLIKPGMRVDVIPTNVKAEEFGAIVGEVVEIGAAPETRASMMRLLNNEIFVTQLSAGGSPLLIRVKLLKDPATPTGFRWSSGTGPSQQAAGKISFGTLLGAQVAVREQAPIVTVIPALRRWFGLHP